MEQRELDMLRKYAPQDPELKELWDDHMLYEKQLEKLDSKPIRTPAEEQTRKQLKKQKLEGKTKLMALLDKYIAQMMVEAMLYLAPFLLAFLRKRSCKVAPDHLGAVTQKFIGNQIDYVRKNSQLLTLNS